MRQFPNHRGRAIKAKDVFQWSGRVLTPRRKTHPLIQGTRPEVRVDNIQPDRGKTAPARLDDQRVQQGRADAPSAHLFGNANPVDQKAVIVYLALQKVQGNAAPSGTNWPINGAQILHPARSKAALVRLEARDPDKRTVIIQHAKAVIGADDARQEGDRLFLGAKDPAKLATKGLPIQHGSRVAERRWKALPDLIAPAVLWPPATGGETDPARLIAAFVTLFVGVAFRSVIGAILAGGAALYLCLWLL